MTESNKKLNSDDRQKALKEAFVKEIREELASDHSGKPSFEDFKKAVEKDRASRRKRRTAIAAGIVVAIFAGFFAFDMLASDVGADKNPKETIVTEDGVIIEDGGWGSSVEDGKQLIITDWQDIEAIKKLYPQLLTPQHVPEGYSFKRLTIERVAKKNILYLYLYTNKKLQNIEIEVLATKEGSLAVDINDIDKEIESLKGIIYSQEENKKATIYFDDGIVVTVWHSISEQELVKVIESIE